MIPVLVVPAPRDVVSPAVPVAVPVALYRHFDARSELLYVGITSDPGRRWFQHIESSFWARFVATTYVQWFPDRQRAQRAERASIRCEEPIFNTSRPAGVAQHNDRKVAYLSRGASGVLRRVPCQSVQGDFCVSCGPDAEAWREQMHERVMAEIERNAAC